MDLSTVSFGLFGSNMLADLGQTAHAMRPGLGADEPPLYFEKRADLERGVSQSLVVLIAGGATDANDLQEFARLSLPQYQTEATHYARSQLRNREALCLSTRG